MSEYKQCAICGSTATQIHHCFYGPNRKVSDKYDECKIDICQNCHWIIHNTDGLLSLRVKQEAQKRFENHYSHEKFMREFGHNYLNL